MSCAEFYPYFLGPYGENDELFERVLVEFLRDHVFWRRNFHPEDPPAIPTGAAQLPGYQDFSARLRRELHQLSAALKHSVPFSSPRYMGHMVSDLLLPGLLAQMITLPYNPNNVVDDVAPVTLDLELSVGLQLARMVGYPADEHRPDCAFGYLPSGGTAANYQALRLAMALKYFPVALARALERSGRTLSHPALADRIERCDDWRLVNLSAANAIELLQQWQALLDGCADLDERRRLCDALAAERIETLGLIGFHQRHPELKPPLLMVPVTAHYSWLKAAELSGLGSSALRHVPEKRMRIDRDVLDTMLDGALKVHEPVLMVVGVLGTTEFGTLDPVHRLVALRDGYGDRGLGFAVHIDAAWGGYLATLFRAADGSLRPRAEVRAEFSEFPSEEVYEAFAALGQTDSVTVDPHKLGYLPFGAGGFCCRDHRALQLLAQDAAYVFHGTPGTSYRSRFRALGRYIVEGSKPGAAAAAAYVTHRVLPLDADHFGRLLRATVRAAEYFWQRSRLFAQSVADVAQVTVPYEPDSNLICLALNPRGNRSLGRMNTFMLLLYEELRVDASRPVQDKQFFGSTTSLLPDSLGPADTRRVLAELGIDPETLCQSPRDPAHGDRIEILRHTLMNPFVRDVENGIDYIDRYFEYLEGLVRRLCSAMSASAPAAARVT